MDRRSLGEVSVHVDIFILLSCTMISMDKLGCADGQTSSGSAVSTALYAGLCHVCVYVQNTDEEIFPEQVRLFPHCDHDYAVRADRSDGKLSLCVFKYQNTYRNMQMKAELYPEHH